MNCEYAKKALPLLLYGELSFDEEESLQIHIDQCPVCLRELERERALHEAIDRAEYDIPAGMLVECRRDLRERLFDSAAGRNQSPGFWARLDLAFGDWLRPLAGVWKPAGAVALVLLGFFAARLSNRFDSAQSSVASASEPIASHVRYIEPESSGQVQIVVDETRQRVLSGHLNEEPIRRLLLSAAKDPSDPGLRVESMDILKSQPESAEVRHALQFALLHDANAGVRLKALDGLKRYAGEPDTRKTLSAALLTDDNPGVRTQAIDLLVQNKPPEINGANTRLVKEVPSPRDEQQLVGTLQELMRKESNNYVRLRCQKALREMNASVETY